MKLSDCAQGRDNNFNLIRALAALGVLVAHSYPLTQGPNVGDPIGRLLGTKGLGGISLDVFFITSGFLVTASLMKRQNSLEFLGARILRIYPALLVMLLLAAFALGPAVTALPRADYLTSHALVDFFRKDGTLLAGGLKYELPGVFDGNPLKSAVVGSLWTMPFEVKMYLMLLGSWVLVRLLGPRRMDAFRLVVLGASAAGTAWILADHFVLHASRNFVPLFYAFFAGAGYWVLRDRVQLTRAGFWCCLAALLLSFPYRQAFFVVYTLTLPYLLLYAAYVPAGFLRGYNRLGDYSYGIYLYGFPVQQTIAWLVPGVSPGEMTLLAAPTTIALAALSWHLVERRALTLKDFVARKPQRLAAA